MSIGFEIAGLALALFPVLVEGLKFYAEEKGTIRDFLHYQHVLKRLVRDLAREHLTFRNSCQRFLEDIVLQSGLPVSAVDEMMRDLEDQRWKDGGWLQEGVLDFESVQRYLETVEDMHEELSKIRNWLGLPDQIASAELLDKKTRRRQWKKIILVIRQDEISEHLDTASRLNTFLARLTDQARVTTPSRHSRHKHTRHYKRIRNHAIDLYHTLNCKFPTPPSCKCGFHQVNVRLEFRGTERPESAISFHTVFTVTAHQPASQSSTPWREIQLESWAPSKAAQITPSHTCQSSVPQQARKWKLPFKKEHKSTPSAPKKVGFLLDQEVKDDTIYPEIKDLCKFIVGTTSSTDWLGFITDGHSRKHRLRDIHQTQTLSQNAVDSQTISLAQLFLVHKAPSREVRSKVGLKLASSVMQLHTTHWLSGTWSAKDIFFLRSADGTAKVNDPLVQRIFGSTGQACCPESKSHTTRLGASIPCLFSLGLVLIELWHWKLFADLKNEQEKAMMSAPVPEISDIMAAGRLIKAMDDAGPSYTAAVQRCIFGVDAACTSLEEDKFRDEVEEKIIFPLGEHVRFFCGKETVEECL